MMKAVHFGAGNIGRGFIGAFLTNAGYEVVFVDVNEKVINEIKKQQSYHVIFANEKKEKIKVTGVTGLNSIEEYESVMEQIAKSSLVTLAIGINNFPKVAKLLSEALVSRVSENKEPLNIIACENALDASSSLREEVYKYLNEDEIRLIEHSIAFVNTAIDRIVPNQMNDNVLDVTVEPYYEWVINRSELIGEVPQIKGVKYVDELNAYIERKLFTVNTGHATIAYVGSYYGYKTISEAIANEEVEKIVSHVLKETGLALIKKYNLDESEHLLYSQAIIERFKNPYIVDEVARVGRDPIRKLKLSDRFIAPVKMYMKYVGGVPNELAKAIAFALYFKNDEDAEAVTIQNTIKEIGIAKAIEKFTTIPYNSEMNERILFLYEELKK